MVSLPEGPGPAGTYFATIFMSIVATMTVGLRFHVRLLRKTKLGADDWTILFGLVKKHWLCFLTMESLTLV